PYLIVDLKLCNRTSGSIQGMALYAREGFKYFAPNGPGWTMNIGIYYTYNPVAGTYYVVQNI
ncbi:hypothetical protein Q97_03351, partial [Enterococcus faecalis EnGen0061]